MRSFARTAFVCSRRAELTCWKDPARAWPRPRADCRQSAWRRGRAVVLTNHHRRAQLLGPPCCQLAAPPRWRSRGQHRLQRCRARCTTGGLADRVGHPAAALPAGMAWAPCWPGWRGGAGPVPRTRLADPFCSAGASAWRSGGGGAGFVRCVAIRHAVVGTADCLRLSSAPWLACCSRWRLARGVAQCRGACWPGDRRRGAWRRPGPG